MSRGCRNLLVIAIVLGSTLLIAVGLGAVLYYSRAGFVGGQGMVALVEIKGPIFESDALLEEIQERRNDDRVKALVVRIDSPGGAVGPSQEVFRELQKTREAGKPVIVSMGSVAASGGLYIACAADYIMANPGTITGSIGVIAEFPNIEGLLQKVGVTFTTLKTGAYKDSGSSFRSMSEEERAVLESLLFDAFAQFTEHVAEGRHLDLETVKQLADGRAYTGRQAIEHGLVDEEGTLLDAIAYAARTVNIEGEPRVLRRRVRQWGPFQFAEELSRFVPSAHSPPNAGIYYLWP